MKTLVLSGLVLAGFGSALAQSPAAAAPAGPVTEVFVDWNHLHKWDESNGDTWDPFWADDDNLYSFNDDGQGFGTKSRNLALNKLAGPSVPALVGSPVNSMDEYGKSGQKEKDNATWKACGQECIDSVFYAFVSRHVYGKESHDAEMRQTAFNASLIKSTDKGLSWTRSAAENYQRPMWPGPRFGAPYFFHYGKNGGQVAQDQADQYVYALSPNGFWNSGDDYILGRAPRGKLADLNPADWSYFAGGDGAGEQGWAAEMARAKPMLSLKSRCGMTGPCYVPALKTYLMVVWYNPVVLTKWYEPSEMVYEFYQAPHPWGPWSVTGSFTDKHLARGNHMYGPSLCAKFQELEEANVKVWMFTSGCPFENVPTGLYKGWAIPLVLSTNPVPASTLLNDNAPAIHYTGSWTNLTPPNAFDYQGDVHRSEQPGAAVELAFTGSGIEFIGQKDKDFGSLAVFLDGKFQENLNAGLVNFPKLSRVVLFRAEGLSRGRHVLRVVNRSKAAVAVDAFRVYF